MKDRVREAVFNLLGVQVAGTHAIDLFAGTGALGLEAISRGAIQATFIERHLPTAKLIEQNAAALGIDDRVQVVFGDAFGWSAAYQPTGETPLTIFVRPRMIFTLIADSRCSTLSPIGFRFHLQEPKSLWKRMNGSILVRWPNPISGTFASIHLP